MEKFCLHKVEIYSPPFGRYSLESQSHKCNLMCIHWLCHQKNVTGFKWDIVHKAISKDLVCSKSFIKSHVSRLSPKAAGPSLLLASRCCYHCWGCLVAQLPQYSLWPMAEAQKSLHSDAWLTYTHWHLVIAGSTQNGSRALNLFTPSWENSFMYLEEKPFLYSQHYDTKCVGGFPHQQPILQLSGHRLGVQWFDLTLTLTPGS